MRRDSSGCDEPDSTVRAVRVVTNLVQLVQAFGVRRPDSAFLAFHSSTQAPVLLRDEKQNLKKRCRATALQRLDAAKDARLLEGGDSFTLLVATVILARVIVVIRPRVPVLII